MKQKSKKYESTLKKIITTLILGIIVIILSYISNDNSETKNVDTSNSENINSNVVTEQVSTYINIEDIPEYTDKSYEMLNNNIPYFSETEYTTQSFEKYSELDILGRCGVAYANICKETMPPEGDKRGDISSVYTTGWIQTKYNNEYLYNRCHLIGYQLSDEDANKLNLITGTRYFNVKGMLPFENQVAEYIDNNKNNHVLYRVTPIFKGDNLVASGVEMEGYSVEDNGQGLCFNVYVYNVQPGANIDYATGKLLK